MKHWIYDKKKGVIKHSSGEFFKIEGKRILNSQREVKKWDQPFMTQIGMAYGMKANNLLILIVFLGLATGNLKSFLGDCFTFFAAGDSFPGQNAFQSFLSCILIKNMLLLSCDKNHISFS